MDFDWAFSLVDDLIEESRNDSQRMGDLIALRSFLENLYEKTHNY